MLNEMRGQQVRNVAVRRGRGRNNARAGVDHDVQLNTARQPDLQVHDVQPADRVGPYVSPDQAQRNRELQAREQALFGDQSVLQGLSPTSQAEAMAIYHEHM